MSKAKEPVIELVVPKELPVYRFNHPYGAITIYSPTDKGITPERVLLLLEQAKFDLLFKHPVSTEHKE